MKIRFDIILALFQFKMFKRMASISRNPSPTPRKVAFDFDDVLVRFTKCLWLYYQKETGKLAPEFETLKSVNFPDVLGCEHAIGHAYHMKLQQSAEWIELHQEAPSSEVLDTLTQLKRAGTELYIVTARESHLREITNQYLNRHFPGIFTEVFFCNGYNQNHSVRIPKSEACLQLGCTVLVDDNLDHIRDVESQGLIGIPFGPHNWSRDHPNHVSTWPELTTVLLNL